MVRSCFFFGASTLAFAALAASYYGDSDYNPRIISILPQSDQALTSSHPRLDYEVRTRAVDSGPGTPL